MWLGRSVIYIQATLSVLSNCFINKISLSRQPWAYLDSLHIILAAGVRENYDWINRISQGRRDPASGVAVVIRSLPVATSGKGVISSLLFYQLKDFSFAAPNLEGTSPRQPWRKAAWL